MILASLCLIGTALSYYLGACNPGPRRMGTTKGWLLALLIGAILASVFYAFSAFGLIVSIESMFSDF